MRTLADLRRTFPRGGKVEWIGLRSARKERMTVVAEAQVTPDGLLGDHGRLGKRAVTLIQAEHLPVIAALAGREVSAADLRRNIVVSGLNLTAAREFGLRIGDVELSLTVPCAPCSRMETVLGAGGYNAMRGHGGWCAEVLSGGVLPTGAEVTVLL